MNNVCRRTHRRIQRRLLEGGARDGAVGASIRAVGKNLSPSVALRYQHHDNKIFKSFYIMELGSDDLI